VCSSDLSAAAIVAGVRAYAPDLRLAGVILNRVGSERHTRLVSDAIRAIGFEVLGAIPRSPDVTVPERHLGLVQASETTGLDALIDRMADLVATHVDLDRVIAAAAPLTAEGGAGARPLPPPCQRIAVARDAAFGFLYPHLLLGWRDAGAEIAFFSPLADEAPARDADVCWLPGGYPELHAGRLAGAATFLDGLRTFAATKPVHGECGGYMVLGRTLTDADGTVHPMAGLLDVATSFEKRRMHLGYRAVETLADGPLGPRGTRLAGHEFHYATVIDPGADAAFALASDAYGATPSPTGSRRGRVSGTFFHVIAPM
jgi:cobyrinic acid a,c-diamide synthase